MSDDSDDGRCPWPPKDDPAPEELNRWVDNEVDRILGEDDQDDADEEEDIDWDQMQIDAAMAVSDRHTMPDDLDVTPTDELADELLGLDDLDDH